MREYDDETLKKVQQLELMILKDFLAICESNNLDYWAIAGTGIGALRHGGFIPWDDDIDIAMPREDFEIMVDCFRNQFHDKYIVMNTDEDPNFPLMTTRIMLKGTKFREYPLRNIDCELGIFLDLYPHDKVSDNLKERKKQFFKAWFFSKLLILRSIPFPVLGFKGIKGKIVHIICACVHYLMKLLHVSKKWIASKCKEACTCCNHYENTEYIDFLCNTTPYKNLCKVSEVYPLKKIKFVDIELNFPNNIHEDLIRVYGDYMKLPPEEKRKNHFPYELDFGNYYNN